MNCDRCNNKFDPKEKREHLGQILCEDCYMEVLSPLKTCDPWAVHSAKTFEKHAGNINKFTPLQAEILDLLTREGPLKPESLLTKCKEVKSLEDLKREFASLRHMEKARAARQGDDVVWRIW
ncbi:MAG: hypothetical protein HUN04_01460 [Desulfobacter sp.]|nr:MAG: hypothetical protein HUN04_01460 [Desulfobacter sp.]